MQEINRTSEQKRELLRLHNSAGDKRACDPIKTIIDRANGAYSSEGTSSSCP